MRLLVGLFVSSSCGLLMIVCVMVICCCLLFESVFGEKLMWWLRLMCISVFLVCCLCFCCGILLYSMGSRMLLSMLCWGSRWKDWKMNLMNCVLIVVCLFLERLLVSILVSWYFFMFGWLSSFRRLSMVDFLELLGLMIER